MKIQLKRSNVLQFGAAKEPTAPQMEYGELAVNYSDADPAIFIKDSANNIIRIGGVGNIADDGQVEVPAESNPPADPKPGNLWYNPEDGRLYVYYEDINSSQWVDASPDGWNALDGASIHVGDQPPTDPIEGSLWWNTTDNTLYIYYTDATSEQWVTASPPGNADMGAFVEKAGDHMAGDLTIGRNNETKITLDATTGAATFAGKIDVGDIFDAGGGTRVNPDGTMFISPNASMPDDTTEVFKISSDSFATSDSSVVFLKNGAATFAGQITAGDGSGNTNTSGVGIGVPGYVSISHFNRPNQNCIQVADTTTNTVKVGVTGSGAATFAGIIRCNPVPGVGHYVELHPTEGISLVDGSITKVNIAYDGSAEFADSVSAGPGDVNNTSTGTGVKLFPGGSIYAAQSSTTPTSPVFYGMMDDGNTETSRINGDGSASFAGSVVSGSIDFESNTTAGAYMAGGGQLAIQRLASDTNKLVIDARKGTAEVFTVTSEGSATFSGLIKTGSDNTNQGTGSWMQNGGGVYTCRPTGSADPTFAGYQQGGASPTFQVSANGTANFAGNVTANGIVLTRASSDLDVGERLEKADAALQSLKTAVANATDFAALKIAMTAALADI